MYSFRKSILLAVAALLYCGVASAQFSIQYNTAEKNSFPPLIITEMPTELDNKFFDRVAWEVERKKLRKERNTIEFNATLETSLQQFHKWEGAEINNFYALATVYYRHVYKKDKFTVDYRVDANYGLNFIEDQLFKNKDLFKISFNLGHTLHKDWSYSATANLRSQFTTGYKSRSEPDVVVSRFMAPGYFDVAAGVTYDKAGSPWKITLSPVGGNIVTIWDKHVSTLGEYGVEAGRRYVAKIGPSVDIYFDKTFGKKEMFRYRSGLYAFTPYRDFGDPIVRWENTVDIRVFKYLTTRLYGQIYYYKAASKSLQYQYSFMIGLQYVYKNK